MTAAFPRASGNFIQPALQPDTEKSKAEYFAEWDAWAQAGDTSGENRSTAVNEMKEWLERNQPDDPLELCNLGLSSLPKHLPPGLRKLDLSHNRLAGTPGLPATLQELDIHDNNVRSVSDLPAGLKVLLASENHVSKVSGLPAGLTCLGLARNRLRRLPEQLPAGLEILDVSDNQLTSLPEQIAAGLRRHCEVYLDNNPLSDRVLANLAAIVLAPGYNGPHFEFSMAARPLADAV